MIGHETLRSKEWSGKGIDLANKIRQFRAGREAAVIVCNHERAERARRKQMSNQTHRHMSTQNDSSEMSPQHQRKYTFTQMCNMRQSIPNSHRMQQNPGHDGINPRLEAQGQLAGSIEGSQKLCTHMGHQNLSCNASNPQGYQTGRMILGLTTTTAPTGLALRSSTIQNAATNIMRYKQVWHDGAVHVANDPLGREILDRLVFERVANVHVPFKAQNRPPKGHRTYSPQF